MKLGKVWGKTQPLIQTPLTEIHKISIFPNSKCSLHKHLQKHNWFYVISGILYIEVHKNDYNLIDTTVLHAGECTTVPPNELHRFYTLDEEVEALEGYYLSPLTPDDIIRNDVGSTNNKN